jgi:hypothetical protein
LDEEILSEAGRHGKEKRLNLRAWCKSRSRENPRLRLIPAKMILTILRAFFMTN